MFSPESIILDQDVGGSSVSDIVERILDNQVHSLHQELVVNLVINKIINYTNSNNLCSKLVNYQKGKQ